MLCQSSKLVPQRQHQQAGRSQSRALRCCCAVERPSEGTFNPASIDYIKKVAFKHEPSAASSGNSLPCSRCTLITQSSLDRWPRVSACAATWDGPVSVAVYVPAPYGTTAASAGASIAVELVAQHVADHPWQGLTVTLLYAVGFAREGAASLADAGCCHEDHPLLTDSGNVDEFRKQQQQQQQQQLPPKYEELYPINALRNAALDAASTPLVLFADGDFAFSSGLADAIAQPWVQDALCIWDDGALPPRRADMQPRMLVLPAFQLNLPEALPDSAVQYKTAPTTAAELAAALACGDAVPFHCGPFAPHTPLIDPATWLAADELLECAYVDRCEPQGIAAAAALPRWDERFCGYGLNKAQHAAHMAAHGFRFLAMPCHFMVTAPHAHTPSWRPVPGSAGDATQLARVASLYDRFKRELDRGRVQ